MPTLPTFAELYDEYKSELSGDPTYQIVDWSPGSLEDIFAMIAATSAQVITRWINGQFLRVFFSTAEGADLDALALDRLNLTRDPGQTDEAFRAEIMAYLSYLERGTVAALTYYASADADVTSAAVSEDLDTGITTITVTLADGATSATVLERLRAGLGRWRCAGRVVNIVEA